MTPEEFNAAFNDKLTDPQRLLAVEYLAIEVGLTNSDWYGGWTEPHVTALLAASDTARGRAIDQTQIL